MPNEQENHAIDIALTFEATKNGILDPTLIRFANRDGLAVNGSTVYGAKESVESLKQSKPHFFSTPNEEKLVPIQPTVKTEEQRRAERNEKIAALGEKIIATHGYDSPEYKKHREKFTNGEPILEEDRKALDEVRRRSGFGSDEDRAFRRNGFIHKDPSPAEASEQGRKRKEDVTKQIPAGPPSARADAFRIGSPEYEADKARFLKGK